MLISLPPADLRALAAACAAGRIGAPCSPLSLRGLLPDGAAAAVAAELNRLAACGCPPAAMAAALEWLASGFEARPALADAVEVVTTGPEASPAARGTAVVVHDLFAHAGQSVLVAGYAVYQGRRVFAALARRMTERPDLAVRLFLDVRRGPGDTSLPEAVAARFLARFRAREWPEGARLPEIYYDPRSLAAGEAPVALHAKCVVVDGAEVFVSSANFTEAAQERNIELGLRLHSAATAERITRFFDALAAAGHLRRLA